MVPDVHRDGACVAGRDAAAEAGVWDGAFDEVVLDVKDTVGPTLRPVATPV